MANQIDYSPMFQSTPETATSRGMSHLSSVLDAIMARDAQERQHKAQLAQAAALAAEDDKRMRDQLNHTIAHDNATEDIAREKNAADEADKASTRALTAMPHFQSALDSGDTAAAQQWAGPGGIGFKPQAPPPPTPAMDLLGALTDKPAPADPLGPQPTGGEQDAMGGRPSGGALVPPAPNPTPSLLDAQLASGPKPPAPPVAPKYDVTLPGGATSVYDPEAAQARRQTRGAQVAGDLGGLQSPSPFHAQALAEVQALAKTGRYKTDDEILKAYEERRKDLEHEADAEKRARIAASAQSNRLDRAHPEGERNVYTRAGDSAGQALTKEDAEQTRKMRAGLLPISKKLDDMTGLVNQMDWKSRLPVVGGLTEPQQLLKGQLDTIMAPITQVLGSGTPQEGEARRKLDSMSVGAFQNQKIAKANIENLRQYLYDLYEQKLGSVAPGYKTAPAAKSLHDEADDLLKGP